MKREMINTIDKLMKEELSHKFRDTKQKSLEEVRDNQITTQAAKFLENDSQLNTQEGINDSVVWTSSWRVVFILVMLISCQVNFIHLFGAVE